MEESVSINTLSDSVENPNTRNKIPFQAIENYLRSGEFPDNYVGNKGKKASLRRYEKHFRFDAQSEALYYSEKPLKPDNVVNINNLRKVLKSEEEVTRALQDVHGDGKEGGHNRWKRVQYIMNQRFYWRRMTQDINSYTDTCLECQKTEKLKTMTPELKPIYSYQP